MKLETFFEKFELFADAPDAVAKMRELVLDLAVHGNLLEDACRKQWAEIRLGEIIATGLPSIDPAGSPNQIFELWSVPAYAAGEPEVLAGSEIGSTKRGLPDRSVLLGKINPHLNRVWMVSRRTKHVLIASPEWTTITPDESWNTRYLSRLLTSPSFNDELCSTAQGMGSLTRASTKKVSKLMLHRPPLAEQKRIVAKVDELMALCDRLEAQQQERETRHAALAGASLARFAEAPTPANLEFLFHNAYAIPPADLCKSILTLAVQGKLVPQDPNDEPTDILLARNDEQRRETATKDRRADAENTSLLSEDDRWDVPESWSWRGLSDLVLFVDYRGKTPAKLSHGVRLLTAKNVRKGRIELSPEEFLSETEYRNWMTRGLPKVGDVLFTTEAPMGNAAMVELTERFALAQRVICFQGYGAIDSSFLVLQILSEQFQAILDKNGTGVTAKGIKASKLKQLPIATPPLAEQRRIVAKVDELMALVDKLEAELASARTIATNLLAAAVAELTQSREQGAATDSKSAAEEQTVL
jgi:type I restriction enzyme S subunit